MQLLTFWNVVLGIGFFLFPIFSFIFSLRFCFRRYSVSIPKSKLFFFASLLSVVLLVIWLLFLLILSTFVKGIFIAPAILGFILLLPVVFGCSTFICAMLIARRKSTVNCTSESVQESAPLIRKINTNIDREEILNVDGLPIDPSDVKRAERIAFYKGSLIAAGFVFAAASLLSHFKLNEFMNLSILIFTPIAAGAITIFFATDSQCHRRKYQIFSPWAAIILWGIVALLFAFETIICFIMIAPLYGILASIGGLAVGSIRMAALKKASRHTTYSLVLLPLFLAPIDHQIKPSTEFKTVSTQVTMEAPLDEVWKGILEVPDISNNEINWTFSHFIGIPKPVSACVSSLRVGGVREIKWQKEVRFEEKITGIIDKQLLSYDVKVDPLSMAIRELDTHVVIGDQYFDVLKGSYQLVQKGNKVVVTLKSTYRMATHINFYGHWWASFVIDEFHGVVLNIIKQRIENNESKRCKVA